MPKTKKEYKPCSLRMDVEVFEVLEAYCKKSGQSKTVAIERAILLLSDKYNKNSL